MQFFPPVEINNNKKKIIYNNIYTVYIINNKNNNKNKIANDCQLGVTFSCNLTLSDLIVAE